MRKAALVLAGLVAVLVLAVVLVPRLIGLNSFKPRIADAVRDATGRELTITGDIDLALLPGISFGVTGITLANAPDRSEPYMVSVGGIEGDLALLPLLGGEIVVERLIIRAPVIALEVDDKGQPNWALSPAQGGDGKETGGGSGEAGSPPRIALNDVRIEQGRLSYSDAVSGRQIIAEGLSLALTMPGTDQALTAKGSMTLNAQPVELELSLDSLGQLQAGGPARLGAKIASALVSLDYQGAVQQAPAPGLDGALTLDVTSVGEAAAWLGQPLDSAQPDPGPLSLTARFSSDQGKIALESAELTGDDLMVSMSGSFDGSGEVKQAVLRLESSLLAIDRYLPAPRQGDALPASESQAAPLVSALPGDLLALLPDTPLDLSALRGLDANISVSLDGLEAAGYELGRVAIKVLLKDGVLNTQLEELALYGGVVRGQAKLDASGDALDAETNLIIESVDVGAIARVAMNEEPPVGGVLSGALRAKARGASPRALAEALSARLSVDLGGLDIDDPAAADLSELKLVLDLPGLDAVSKLTGTAVYKRKPVSLVLDVAPLETILSGEAFDLKAQVVSALVTAGYEGQVQQQPLPGLDGSLAVDIGSVGELAAWLGQPLDAAQPDPGPLKLTASFAADRGKVALEQAVIEGEALKATASGSFDGTGDVNKIVLELNSGILDIDRYLPKPGPISEPQAADASAAESGVPTDILALLSDQPLDLSALRGTEADISVSLGGIKAIGYEVGAVVLGATLQDGRLDAELRELALYGGRIVGKVTLDGSGDGLGAEADLAIDSVNIGDLAKVALGGQAPVSGVASGSLQAAATGASPRALAEALSAKLAFDLGGIDIADPAAAELSELKLALDLPGLEAASTLTGSVVYKQQPVTLDLDLAPLKTILAGEAFDLKAQIASALVTAGYEGRVQVQPVPGLDGDLAVEIGSVGELAAWLGQPLDAAQPDPGPLKLTASFAADQGKVALEQAVIEGEALKATASGSFDGTGEVQKITLKLDSGILDIDRYLPKPGPREATQAGEPAAAESGAPTDILALLSDEPLDLSALRGTEAEIAISLSGIKAVGYEVGRVVLAAVLVDGVLEADLRELSLYDGRIAGKVRLDGAGAALGAETDLIIDAVNVGHLARAVMGDQAPVSGVASGALRAKAEGASPRALAEALSASLSFDLGGIDLADPAAADISGLTVALDLPGLEAPSSLTGSVIYKQEQVSLDLDLAPLKTILAGEAFDLKAQITSALVSAGYQGRVQQQPLPGLDGDLAVDISSVGKLAAWLGQPLDAAQPDPGPLKLTASFAADQGKVALEQAVIEGESLKATASGSFDGTGKVQKIILKLDSGILDIDRYLPKSGPNSDPQAADASAAESSAPTDILALLSDEPLDLSALRGTEADISVSLSGIKAVGYEIGAVVLGAVLKDGRLNAELRELAFYGGRITGKVALEGLGDALGAEADLAIDSVNIGDLAKVALGDQAPVSGVASGSLQATATGASPRALAEALSAKLAFDLGGIDIADPAAADISGLTVALDLPGLGAPSSLTGSVIYKQEQVSLNLDLAPLETILAGEAFDLKAQMISALVTAGYQGRVQVQPLPGLDGDLAVEIGSVGELAAWLGQPLDAAQPDPGPLKLTASFAADQGKVALEQAVIEGEALKATASGSFDGTGEVNKITLELDSGILDIDRYLPKPDPAAAPQPAGSGSGEADGAGPTDLLALLSEQPLDLSMLRGTEADISVSLSGIKAVGYEIGSVVLGAVLKDGRLDGELRELALYSGRITGKVALDGSGEGLGVETDLAIDSVNIGDLAKVALGDQAPVSGVASGSLQATATGASPRALAEALSAKLAFDLGGIDIADPAAAELSELKLALDLPGLDAASTLTGSVVYKQQPVTLDLALAPLETILAGEAFDLKAQMISALVTAGYEGRVQVQPLPGLDGDLAVEIGSVGELAAWLGQPLDAAQPDPGPLKLTASFAADQGKIALEQAVIVGEALEATASGSFDGTGEVRKIVLQLDSGILDIDRYLPKPGPSAEPPIADTGAAENGEPADILALLSDQPLDLSVLRGTEADVSISLGGIKAAGYEVGRVVLAAVLSGGVLEAELRELSLYDGRITGKARLDGAADTLGAKTDLTVDAVNVGDLARAVMGDQAPVSGVASGVLRATATGTSPRALAEALSASLSFDLGGIDIADPAAADISGLTVALELPGLEAPSSLTGSVVYKQERVSLDLDLAPLKTILAGEAFDLKAQITSALVSAGYQGRVQQRPLPGLDGDLAVEIGSVAELVAWLGQPLDATQPDPGPLKLTASFAADQGKVALEQAVIEGEALRATASGSFDGTGEIRKITLVLDSGILDIDRYLPKPDPATAAQPAEAGSGETEVAGPGNLLALLSDQPLDLSALRGTEADISVSLSGVKAAGYEIGRVVLGALLKQGVLDADLRELALYGGQIAGTVRLDGSGADLEANTDLAIDAVNIGDLARAALGDAAAGDPAPVGGVATGSLRIAAKGVSPRALAEALSAQIAFDLSGVDLADPAAADLTELQVALDLPGLAAPSTLAGSAVYKQERVDVNLGLAPLDTILSGDPFELTAQVVSALMTASYQGRVQHQPVPGLDGTLNLNVASVGKLAAWLGQPLDPAQPDPGALKLSVSFAADQGKVALERAVIESAALKATASGSFDGTGAVNKITLKLDSGVLDIDRYLPKADPKAGASQPAASGDGAPRDFLAMLSDQPLDLTALRGTEADISVSLGGIKAAGYEIGKIVLAALLEDGILNADLQELALYGGNLRGAARLDGAGAALNVATDLTIDRVDVGKLAKVAMGGEAPVGGVASGSLQAKASGASPRALAEALSAKLSFDLGGIAIADPAATDISGLKVALDLPGLDAPSKLNGSVVYKQQAVDVDLDLAPLKTILAGEAFELTAKVASALVNAGYRGKVQLQPVPGLDGALDLDIGSVGKLAAWLGQPLDPAQPDPGPLELSARFAADQGKVALEQGVIKGDGLAATASGSFDGRGEVKKIVLKLDGGLLDIDRYLPKLAPRSEPAQGGTAAPGAPGDLTAGLSDAPLDLSALRLADAEIELSLAGIKAAGFELGKVALDGRLSGGVLNAKLTRLALYGGTISGTTRLDASGKAAKISTDLAIDKLDFGALGEAALGGPPPATGRISGTLSAQASGASPKALAEALAAKLAVQLAGLAIQGAPDTGVSDLAITADLPGLAAPTKITLAGLYKGEQVSADLSLDPIKTILAGETFALVAKVTSPLVTAGYDGRVQQQPLPGLDGKLAVDIASVGKLAAWLGTPLDARQPDPGPLKIDAAFAADRGAVALEQATIQGRAANARASGRLDTSGALTRFDGTVTVDQLDLDAYLPPPEKAAAAGGGNEPAAQQGWSTEPIDLDALRSAEGKVLVEVASARYRGLELSDGRITLDLSKGVLRTAIEKLGLARGSIAGAATLDASGKLAGLDYQLTVSGVESRPILRAFADTDRLSGKLQFETSGAARGASQKQIVEGLNGKGQFAFLDGAIHGINLAAALRQVGALGLADGTEKKTDFSELSGSFTITNGLLNNPDLKMLAPLVRLTGAGDVPLPPRTIDYLVEAKLVASLEGQGGDDSLAGLPIPVSITGPWSNPKYGVDWESMFLQAATDPSRLANMPTGLRDAAKGFGVDLPIPKIPGLEGAGEGGVGAILQAIPGLAPGGEEGGDLKEGVTGALQNLLSPGGTDKAPDPVGQGAAVPSGPSPSGPAPSAPSGSVTAGPAPSGSAPSPSGQLQQLLSPSPSGSGQQDDSGGGQGAPDAKKLLKGLFGD